MKYTQIKLSGKCEAAQYADLGADFYTRRESPDARQDYLMRQLQTLNPGCVITITPAETA